VTAERLFDAVWVVAAGEALLAPTADPSEGTKKVKGNSRKL
jgi:hypothetical protein